MAAGDVAITIVGNIADDPSLRYTPDGKPITRCRVAAGTRYLDTRTGQWTNGPTLYVTCTLWHQMAENAAESIDKGTRVIVRGRLRQRIYNESGDTPVMEIDVDEIAPTRKFVAAKVTKNPRPSGGSHRADLT